MHPQFSAKRFFSRKELFLLIIPLVIEQFLAIAVGFADTIMVSYVGENSVSGVSLVDSINILVIQIFSALATGGAVVAAQYIGRSETNNACRSAKQLLNASIVLSGALMAICLCFRKFILSTVFGKIEQEVMEVAVNYFLITSISYPFLAIFNSCAALYRAVGNSRVSMFVALIMNVLNVAGNAVGIYVLGWGAAGAAISTLISRIAGAIIMLVLISHRGQIIFIDSLFRPEFDWNMTKRILAIGIPSGFENGAFQVGKLMIASLVTTFGTAAIAANAISGTIASISNIPGSAIGLAMVTVVGQCMGAGDHVQARFYVRKLMIYTYVAMNALCAYGYFCQTACWSVQLIRTRKLVCRRYCLLLRYSLRAYMARRFHLAQCLARRRRCEVYNVQFHDHHGNIPFGIFVYFGTGYGNGTFRRVVCNVY